MADHSLSDGWALLSRLIGLPWRGRRGPVVNGGGGTPAILGTGDCFADFDNVAELELISKLIYSVITTFWERFSIRSLDRIFR